MRLASVQGVVNFAYDEFGRLMLRRWQDARGAVESYYDGPDAALELRLPASGGQQWLRYVYGPGDDQPLALELYPVNAQPTPGTGQAFYYHPDGEGSIRLLTDASGQAANAYSYDSFGVRLTASESVSQPYGWKGREFLAGPNLYANRARFYDPVMGRFLSEDPIGFDSGDANWYRFGWNNPRNWNDPSGLAAAAEEGGTSGIIGGSASGVVAVEGGQIATGAQAARIAATTGSPLQGIGARIACILFTLDKALELAQTNPGAEIIPMPTLCSAAALPLAPDRSDAQRQKEYDKIKPYCDSKPPGSGNECSDISRAIDRTKYCIKMYTRFDNQWNRNHSEKIGNWENRLALLKEEHKQKCTRN